MAEDQRKGWLADLKVGDKVFVSVHAFDHTVIRMEVTKITPTGRISCGASEFNPYGNSRGRHGWNNQYLLESTKDTTDKWKREQLISSIKHWTFDMSKVSLETLEMVWHTIKSATPKEIS